MNPVSKPATETALTAWGNTAPSWVMMLAKACDKDSQATVARRMKRSASLVNQVLKKTYKGDLTAVQSIVETVLTDAIDCPILGEIKGDVCFDWHTKPYSSANPHLVRMFRACQKCPHNQCKKG